MGSVDGQEHNPQIEYTGDGGRPEVQQYDVNSALRPNDQVYIRTRKREGLFTVREVRNGKCTLLNTNGALVDSGKWFDENDLELDE